MATEIYNFPDIKKGDTFLATPIVFPFSIAGACIVMQFKRRADNPVVFEWSTTDNSLSVISNTEVMMTDKIMDFPAYNYSYDCVVTFLNGPTVTYFEGKLKINEKISNKCQV